MLLGFDIGGTKCAVILGVTDANNGLNIIQKTIYPTNLPVFEMIECLFGAAEQMLIESGISKTDLQGIGISCGGPLNSKTGMILSPPNLPGWDNIPIVQLAQERFGVMAVLQNDANACAMAEWRFGAGRGAQHIIFLTFGTGMGAGLILDGKLYSGPTDTAGEVGHMRLAPYGPVGYGKAGSFEGFCSGGGIAQLAQTKVRERLQMGEKVSFCPTLNDLDKLTAKLVAEAASEGDALAIEIYKISAEYLATGLSILIDILNPERIVIGGIYPRAQHLLEPWLKPVLDRETLQIPWSICKIVPAELCEQIGDYAALAVAGISGKD